MITELCCICNNATGRAGKFDDSLYRDDSRGPFCEDCWNGYSDTRTDTAKDAMREALNNLADAVDKWNAAVETIIGHQPETGMATAEARAALALDKEQNDE